MNMTNSDSDYPILKINYEAGLLIAFRHDTCIYLYFTIALPLRTNETCRDWPNDAGSRFGRRRRWPVKQNRRVVIDELKLLSLLSSENTPIVFNLLQERIIIRGKLIWNNLNSTINVAAQNSNEWRHFLLRYSLV